MKKAIVNKLILLLINIISQYYILYYISYKANNILVNYYLIPIKSYSCYYYE